MDEKELKLTGQISNFHAEIIGRLAAVRAKENRVALLHGLLLTFVGIIGMLLIVVVLERIFSFGTGGRAALFAVLIAGCAAIFIAFAGKPLLKIFGIVKKESNWQIAERVGGHFRQIRDRLLDALQMYEGKEALRRRFSPDLIDASFIDLYEAMKPLAFTDAVSSIRVRRMGRIAFYSSAVIILMLVIAPLRISMMRVFTFNTTYAAPVPLVFHIEPGNTEIVRGQNVSVVIRTEGKPARQILFHTRQAGQIEFDEQTLPVNNEGLFRTELSNLKTTTDYFASVEDVNSDTYKITVLDRPLIRSLHTTIVPPAYTRLPEQKLEENTGDVTAYPGSRIETELASSKDIFNGQMVFSNGRSIALTCAGGHATGSFAVNENLTYHFMLRDRDGLETADPVEYSVKILPDEYPSVEITSPARNLDMTEQMQLDVGVQVKDDFGFTSVRLAYRLAHSRYEAPAKDMTYVDIPFSRTMPSQDLQYHWDLGPLSLVPEDVVEYYAEAHDNDNVNGPKSSRSQTYMIRLPSLDEVFSDVDQSHDQNIESVQDVQKQAEELKKNVEEIQRNLQTNKDKADWHQQQKADQMMKQYAAMKQKLDEVSHQMDEMVKKMDENKLLSPQTMEKYSEMQKLLDELNSPELQAALKKLQEMMKQPNITPEQMQQAMNQLKMNEDAFRQSLERTIELLKRIHIEQKLDELVKRAEDLRKQQENLKQQAAQTNPGDTQKREDLAKQQEDLQKEANNLEKETADLKQKMEEFEKEMPMDEMNKAQQDLTQQQLAQKMQNSSQQMRSGQMQQAQQSQQQTQQGLQQFEDDLQSAQKSLQDRQMKEVANQMRKQLENILELSKRQESLKEETEGMDPNTQRFREGAQRQDEMMNDLGNVAQSMTDLAKKSFAVSPEMGKEVGNALQKMGESLNQMEGRDPGGASQSQNEAMSALNRAAMMMGSALNGLQSGGQGGMGMSGLMGRLQQMMGQQAGVNQGTQSAMGMGQGQNQMLSAQQQSEYQRLSNQQGAVRKSLEELSQEAKNSGDYSKLLGDLDKIAQEMKEVESDLAQSNVNPETVRKEDHILSRLLDSQRSTRERDYEKRRKAEAGKTYQHASPGEIDLATQEGKDKLREELLKVLQGRYSKDYEDLIRRYFEELEKEKQ